MGTAGLLEIINKVTGFEREIDYGTWNDRNRIEWRSLCTILLDRLAGYPKYQQQFEAELALFDGSTYDSERMKMADEINLSLETLKRFLNQP